MQGVIVSWNDALGQGQIQSSAGTFAFQSSSCSPRLQARLAGHTIPPGQQVSVIFDVDPISGEAVNVDFTGSTGPRG